MPEQARMDHNARIKADMAAAEPRRAAFLASHLDVLMPFITPQVAAHIRCARTSAFSAPPCPPAGHTALKASCCSCHRNSLPALV